MRIYIIRHGETQENHEGIIQGHKNTQLLERGVRMAETVGEKLGKEGVVFDAAFSSPLDRAMVTAQSVLNKSGNENVELVPEPALIECCMGVAEGKRFRDTECEINTRLRDLFIQNPFHFHGFPEGETTMDVIKRTHTFMRELIEQPYECVLLSMHGFALRALLNFAYDDPCDFWHGHVPYNCSISVLEQRQAYVSDEGNEVLNCNDSASYEAHFKYLDSLLGNNDAEPCTSTYLRNHFKLVEDDAIYYAPSMIIDTFK